MLHCRCRGVLSALGRLKPIRITPPLGIIGVWFSGWQEGVGMGASKGAQRWRISDELWEELKRHIPQHPNTHRFGGGRPRKSDRDCADAIFFVLRTGCQWKALDATAFVPGSTAHDRFQ